MVLNRTPTSQSPATAAATPSSQAVPQYGQQERRQEQFGPIHHNRYSPSSQQEQDGRRPRESRVAARPPAPNTMQRRAGGGESVQAPKMRKAALSNGNHSGEDDVGGAEREGPMRFASPNRLEGRILDRKVRNGR